jgi:hypothetical protein
VPNNVDEWPVEDIPDEDRLFLRVHREQVRPTGGKLHPGVFREHGDSMSVDWERYSRPEESRNRATHPEHVGIVQLVAGGVRTIDGLSVLHAPDRARNNRAHSGVFGITNLNAQNPAIRKTAVRAQLFTQFHEWLLEPGQ